jgi:hypothetical protein
VFVFFAVIAAGLMIAVLLGGDVRRLSQIRLIRTELLVAAFGIKVMVALLGDTHSTLAVSIARPLNIAGAGLLLLVVWLNRRIAGAAIFGLGLALNLLAIISFGGRMPVVLPADTDLNSPTLAALRHGLDPLHVWLQHPQGLWFIGDVFTIANLGGHRSLVSVGDLLMSAGIAWLIIRRSQKAQGASPSYAASPSQPERQPQTPGTPH